MIEIPKEVQLYLSSIPHTATEVYLIADLKKLAVAIQETCGVEFVSELTHIFIEKRNPELAAVRQAEKEGKVVRFPSNKR